MTTRNTLSFALLAAASLSGGIAHATPHFAPQTQEHQTGKHADGGKAHSAFNNAEFDRFHDILHPLQHEALPKNDFATIRREAKRLVAAGRPLTRGFVPAGVTDTAKFCEELANFADALKRFDRDAKRKDDEAMKRSYIRVHDTFEEMAHLLPRR
jgi:hypothetical protein